MPKHRTRLAALLVVMMTAVAPCLKAQVWEDFSDGDFSQSPTWTGDTSKFRINSSLQLQLYADSAGTALLSFPYSMPADDTIVWEFWMKTGFTPTANNYTVTALYSDSADLLAASHYMSLVMTDPSLSGKRITLYQDDSLLFVFPYQPTRSTNPLRIKAMLVNRHDMTLWIDTVGATDSASYSYAGSTVATTSVLPQNAHFGVYCQYTASRAHLSYFDDIGINRPADTVPTPPTTTYMPKPGELLISEILFNPEPGGADYVELYNNSDSTIDLGLIRLAKLDSDSSVARLYSVGNSGSIAPHDLLVITTDAAYVSSHYTVRHPDKMVEVGSMPAYNDDKGCVVIANADSTLLDRLDYSEKMHSALLHDKEGVALERRSYNTPTQQTENWYSAASTAGYGTPTAKNSQSREFLFVDNDFHTELTLFSPDGDGYNDLLDITYSLQLCDLSCNIDVYDSRGRLVKHLLRGALLGCEGVVSWDGTDNDGNSCPRGNYLIVAEAYNTSGARQSWRRRVSIVR